MSDGALLDVAFRLAVAAAAVGAVACLVRATRARLRPTRSASRAPAGAREELTWSLVPPVLLAALLLLLGRV